MTPRRIKLVIKSSLENVSMIGYAVNKICSQIPLDEEESYQTELCICEACNNVIKHAYKNNPNHDVEVVVSLYADKIVFDICDSGVKLKEKPTPTLDFKPDDLEHLPEGGMGLFIMKNLMHQVDYRAKNGKNILTLIKFFYQKQKTPLNQSRL
ncbi:MAG: ATP-binding protein [bacterium]